jgi:antitoxin (DNA-binding transcriptional repressor) of toxin-antitoxin stability system
MGRMGPETTKTERIGIRALQVNALAIVRRVALGRRFTVTDGGRPVAQLVPLGAPRPSPPPGDPATHPAAPPEPGAES